MALFAVCTMVVNGVRVQVNLDAVNFVEPDQNGSIIRFSGGGQLNVREMPEHVVQAAASKR